MKTGLLSLLVFVAGICGTEAFVVERTVSRPTFRPNPSALQFSSFPNTPDWFGQKGVRSVNSNTKNDTVTTMAAVATALLSLLLLTNVAGERLVVPENEEVITVVPTVVATPSVATSAPSAIAPASKPVVTPKKVQVPEVENFEVAIDQSAGIFFF